MKNGLGNLAASDADQLTATIKNRLKSIQYPDWAHPRARTAADLSLSTSVATGGMPDCR
jgi:hypothetical protein